MAFSGFASSGNGAFGVAPAQNPASGQDPDLEDIQTEGLGFLSLAGEAKVQLLPTRWPADKLPPPTSSLMSVASNKGLVAAAGPDSFIVATTESVRKAFEGPKVGDSDIRAFQPQLSIPMPMRISQLAFSADETYLVLSAEEGGGLAVYEVQSLLQGSTQSAFEVSTNGQALRALLPNPTPEKAELFAVVTTDGNLMMANLKERAFIRGANGEVLKTGVSCVSWSTRGKQLIAGLGDGTAFQMTPEGEGKAVIPRAPSVDANHHVSSLSWLENNIFLIVYTPSKFDDDRAPDSIFQIVNRQSQTNCIFQKISDPAPPFGLNRSPPHHFILRLKDFGNLQDLLVVASTASIDLGLFSRSKTPLVSDKPADKITGVFTMTEMANDSRRAQLPMTEDMTDTSPIGIVLDLSATEKVEKPVPGDEMTESLTPLPALMALNNEGVLAGWWVVYSESVRQGIAYSGLVAAGNSQQPQTAITQAPASTFGNPTVKSSFGQPPTFGTRTGSFSSPGLGSNTAGIFGTPGAFNKAQSPWGAPNSAAPTQSPAPATFGNTGGLGQRVSPWAAAPASSGSVFGQTSIGAKPAAPFGSSSTAAASPFGSATTISNGASGGGFAGFANKGGFATVGAPASGGSIFAQKPAESSPFGSSDNKLPFGGPSKSADNPFGSTDTKSSFGGTSKPVDNPFAPKSTASLFGGIPTEKPANPFGAPFQLGSTFKPDGTAKDDLPKPDTTKSDSLFGSGFGNALGDVAKSPATVLETQEADMDDMKDEEEQISNTVELSTSSTPAMAPGIQFKTDVPPVQGGLFGIPGAKVNTPPIVSSGTSAGFSIGKPVIEASQTEKSPTVIPFAEPSAPSEVKVKPEPESDDSIKATLSNVPPAPKVTAESAAPLPPSWIPPVEKSKYADFLPPSDVPGGPAEDEDSGADDGKEFETDEEEEEGRDEDHNTSVQNDADESSGFSSGEDVTKDLSESDNAQTPGFTPTASFGGQVQESPVGGLFSKINKPAQQPAVKPLFGEFGNGNTPVLPPSKLQESPRSPSPVRAALPSRLTRSDSSRSFSAPGIASQILDARKTGSRQQAPPGTAMKSVEEEKRDEDRRREEARARKEAEEAQALIDKEDQAAQAFLQSKIEGTKTLDEFIAHQDYVGHADKDSIPAQVETVYRDINSMIDTLGLNARALAAFIKGHREQYKEGGRNKDDLDSDEDWCLVEIEDLTNIVEKDLTQELNDGRVIDVPGKLDTCYELQKEQNRLAAKHDDIKRIFAAETDPDHQANTRAQPLSAEQLAQQSDLRKEFTEFQRLLSEAEEGLTLLKAKLAGASGVGRVKGATIPTVENVMRTVMKMTAMAEKRSGDIDVLENQMRRLRFSSVSSIGSREGSPFETPTKSRLGGSTFGFSYSPETPTQSPRRLNASMMSSTMSNRSNRHATPPRKKLSGFSEEEKTELRMKVERRDQVKNKLRDALRKSGMKVRSMDED